MLDHVISSENVPKGSIEISYEYKGNSDKDIMIMSTVMAICLVPIKAQFSPRIREREQVSGLLK